GGSGVNSIQGAVVTTAIGTGTEGADVIEVSETSTGAIMVTVNGTMSTFAAGTRVRVDALGGDDRVTLRNLNVDAVVDAGAGNDTLICGSRKDLVIDGEASDGLLRRLRMCLDAHDLDSNLHSVLDLWRDGSKEAHGRTR